MDKGFTFDGALMFPFRAAHARSFPWKFALAMAIVSTVLTGVFLYLVRGLFFNLFDELEGLSGSGGDELERVFATLFRFFGQFAPWMVLSVAVSWVIWAMFTAATQRRYIFDEDFSLRFGPDELRMMGVGAIWYAAQSVVSIIPLILMAPIFTSLMGVDSGEITEEEFVRMIFGRMGLIMLSMLVIMPFYIFFATRFSPVFAMTVKEGKIAFRDAWIVSRGRFWPILGAYLIIAIVGGMVVGFASSIAEMVLMPAFMSSPAALEDMPDLHAVFTPAVMIGILFYLFVRFFMSGLLVHFAQGPAAFAARHDPRGSIDDALKVTDFD